MKVGIGQNSYIYDSASRLQQLVLGGVALEEEVIVQENDAYDVVLHALTNAISSVTCVNIYPPKAESTSSLREMIDSKEYLRQAMTYLKENQIVHAAISIECSNIVVEDKINAMRINVARLLGVPENCVGITMTPVAALNPLQQQKSIRTIAIVTVL